jgi:hypothetical protein
MFEQQLREKVQLWEKWQKKGPTIVSRCIKLG